MKVLTILNYYFPYVSGLSEYARLLCEELAKRGHDVTVLTSNHADLQPKEEINGVEVIRAPIWFKVSKGTISPKFILWALKYAKEADVVNLHLPMLEAGIISLMIPREKIICTYHCDINLPDNLLNNIISRVMDMSHRTALHKSSKIVVNTIEYMQNSRIAGNYMEKLNEIAPPIKQLPTVEHLKHDEFRIGFCGRIVEEKGIDVLIRAFELLQKEKKNVTLIIGGDYEAVAGGSVYEELKKYIDSKGIENIFFKGKIPEEKMAAFYASLDVLVLPSINSLESFGMVQVEAMMCGTPVIASDLLGVRTIVQKTGMGLITKRGDAEDLKNCIIELMDNYSDYIKETAVIKALYGADKCACAYEEIMSEKAE